MAHAGEEHVTNQQGLLHAFTTNFLKYFVISLIFISIIFLLAYASKPKKSPKQKEDQNE